MSVLITPKAALTPADMYDLVGGECTCEVYDADTDVSTPSPECWGDCGDWRMEDFVEACRPHFRPRMWATWYPTWQGNQPVTIELKELKDIVYRLAPRSGDYLLKYRLVKEPGRGNRRVWIAVWLAHHDGSRMYFF